jgi:hypothetical protein
MRARGIEWVLLNFRLRWGIFLQREGKQTFVLSPPHKFLGSFRSRKSANVLGVPVRKSQIRKFLWLIYK